MKEDARVKNNHWLEFRQFELFGWMLDTSME